MVRQTDIPTFVQTVSQYYLTHGRDLTWRKNISPYAILVSEIMLQQTQVSRVLHKFPEFLIKFPDFTSLARAPLSDVLRIWQGMGYNRRAKYLHELAIQIMDEHQGVLPQDPEILKSFPGIGAATAGSIACFAFNKPTVFIETNIRRSILFHFFPHKNKVTDTEVRKVVEQCVQYLTMHRSISFREWYWALMDYGSYLKSVVGNPNTKSKHYVKFSDSKRKSIYTTRN
jgi:A/G-specific adenine glycosylase